MEGTKYRLFALKYGRSAMEIASRERFSRATPDYILIYSDQDGPEGAVEITEAELGRLSASDSQWLFDCNAALISEETERRMPEILAELSRKLEALGAELEAARR